MNETKNATTNKSNYPAINFKVEPSLKELISEAAWRNRTSMQGYILEAIHEKLRKDGLE